MKKLPIAKTIERKPGTVTGCAPILLLLVMVCTACTQPTATTTTAATADMRTDAPTSFARQ